MPAHITTMLSVTDTARSIAWCQRIGFHPAEFNPDAGPVRPVNWRLLDHDGARLMPPIKSSDGEGGA